MRGVTHAAFGAAAALALGCPGPAVGLCVVGALAPDLDEPGSLLGRWVPGSLFGRGGRLAAGVVLGCLGLWFGQPWLVGAGGFCVLSALARHRGFTHSLLAAGVLAAAFRSWPVFLGYMSHLFLDMLSGRLRLFWPLRRRAGLRAPGIPEAAFCAACCCLVAAFLLLGGRP